MTGHTRATIGTAPCSMPQELMETIWVAGETPAGGTCGYLAILPTALERVSTDLTESGTGEAYWAG